MNLLLDTHVLIWALNDDPKLSEKARRLILDENNLIFYSAASIWEVSIKHANHPNNIEFTGEDLIRFCDEAGFLPLEIKGSHVIALESITRPEDAPPHNDPFDRILLAQAKSDKMQFLTHDTLIPYYNEKCIVTV